MVWGGPSFYRFGLLPDNLLAVHHELLSEPSKGVTSVLETSPASLQSLPGASRVQLRAQDELHSANFMTSFSIGRDVNWTHAQCIEIQLPCRGTCSIATAPTESSSDQLAFLTWRRRGAPFSPQRRTFLWRKGVFIPS